MQGDIFDTNILIDYLKGFDVAYATIQNATFPKISQITWIEVMVGATNETRLETEAFLSQFDVVPMNDEIARQAVEIRQKTRMKLPDAIIWATAKQLHCHLITRNTKDFSGDENDVIVPYQL